jgi:hypothetical protein
VGWWAAATTPANDCFAAGNLGSRMPGLGRFESIKVTTINGRCLLPVKAIEVGSHRTMSVRSGSDFYNSLDPSTALTYVR